MILYHGTVVRFAINIVNDGILPTINKNNELDFGYGFYLGDLRYAKRIAINKSESRKLRHDYNVTLDAPIIIAYRVDLKKIINKFGRKYRILLKSRRFRNTVFKCRYNKGKDVLNAPYIEAPVADGRADDIMEWYKKKENLFRKVIALFNYGLPSFHRQLVIKDTRVLDYIERKSFYRKENVVWVESLEVIK